MLRNVTRGLILVGSLLALALFLEVREPIQVARAAPKGQQHLGAAASPIGLGFSYLNTPGNVIVVYVPKGQASPPPSATPANYRPAVALGTGNNAISTGAINPIGGQTPDGSLYVYVACPAGQCTAPGKGAFASYGVAVTRSNAGLPLMVVYVASEPQDAANGYSSEAVSLGNGVTGTVVGGNVVFPDPGEQPGGAPLYLYLACSTPPC